MVKCYKNKCAQNFRFWIFSLGTKLEPSIIKYTIKKIKTNISIKKFYTVNTQYYYGGRVEYLASPWA